MSAFAFLVLDHLVEILGSVMLVLAWTAAVILGNVLFFLVGIVLFILDLLKGMTVATVLGAMVLVAIILMLALIKSGGVAAMMLEEDGSPSSRANIKTGDMELTVGEDGCPAGDAVETDAAVDEEEEDGRPVTAAEAVPFEPRRSPRIAAQTQTRVEPRRSRRITTNRKRADSLQNVGLQSRRSPRIAARLMRGV